MCCLLYTSIEKEAELGGKLRGWHVLFPSFTPASEILTELRRRIAERGIEVMTRTEARGFSREGVQLPDGRMLACDSVVVLSLIHILSCRWKPS